MMSWDEEDSRLGLSWDRPGDPRHGRDQSTRDMVRRLAIARRTGDKTRPRSRGGLWPFPTTPVHSTSGSCWTHAPTSHRGRASHASRTRLFEMDPDRRVGVSGPLGACRRTGSPRSAPARHDRPPRKVIIGTTMTHWYSDYPGLDGRLEQMRGLIDAMAAEARAPSTAGPSTWRCSPNTRRPPASPDRPPRSPSHSTTRSSRPSAPRRVSTTPTSSSAVCFATTRPPVPA